MQLYCIFFIFFFIISLLTLYYTMNLGVVLIYEAKIDDDMITNTESNEEILARIGHDLKGMIARIRSCSYVLYKNFEKDLDEDSREFFHSIERDCTEIKSIIHNLIAVDQCYEENPELEFHCVHINSFLTDTIQAYHTPQIKEKKVKLHFEDTEESIHIHIDQKAIRRVIESILSNAVKFSNAENDVVIKLIRYANVAHISISDQGIGIPKKLRPYMFDKFSRATRRGTGGEESSGLGLYIAKNIVEKHQGSIWYESEEGRGTNFYIDLPVRERF